jgi:hypothetical protein
MIDKEDLDAIARLATAARSYKIAHDIDGPQSDKARETLRQLMVEEEVVVRIIVREVDARQQPSGGDNGAAG